MALGTVVRDIYTDSTRSSMHKTIDELLGTADWHTAGLYCYWDPATQEALYIGLAQRPGRPLRTAQQPQRKQTEQRKQG
ncbi:hypothetical protein [Rhodococcus erythropolis]|uniref:hypothetical protein n=1 Tax=Rhodococcus erythropolis TaxID=1833 RepID=UPI001BE94C9E|nr:hypothetical protein [Rhodococcus erythropolis]MBT2269699.1 hypothetical protein [Rhodococcus erythropolis]